ncbi:hypothetical protein ABIA39_000783 [Nocardia sp. GAS34]|uniref:hypothetical protein n=1 Tax=unclassified Nocardia TaxID=2637762 RepID=UPI003D1A30F6
MDVLILRVALPVMTILVITALQRRLGHRLGGRVAGLPLYSFPFLAIILITDGRTAAAQAAAGVASGLLVVVVFGVGYGRLGQRLRSPLAAVVVTLGIIGAALILVAAIGSAPVMAVLVVVATAAALLLWPPVAAPAATTNPARWELPVRMLVIASIMVCLTEFEPVLGAHLAGLLACAPVGLWIIALTTHRRAGFPAAENLLNGALHSCPGTLVFALTLAYGLRPWGAAAFGIALIGLFAMDHLFRRLVGWGRNTLQAGIFGHRSAVLESAAAGGLRR